MHSSKDPLHGVTLEALLNALVARYGWAEMARQVNINCFKSDPSIKSSLKFLRRAAVSTPARIFCTTYSALLRIEYYCAELS